MDSQTHRIRSGTLSGLIVWLTDPSNKDGECSSREKNGCFIFSAEYIRAFFHTYRSFCRESTLLRCLIRRFTASPPPKVDMEKFLDKQVMTLIFKQKEMCDFPGSHS